MNAEQQREIIEETNQPGRDFLEVLKNAPKYDQKWRIEAMQTGDYINMPGKEFKRWVSFLPTDKETLKKLDELDEVKVKIKEIIKTKDRNDNTIIELLVEGGGVCKKVHASLFYNYGDIRLSDVDFTSDYNSGFDNQDHGDYNVG